MKNPTMTLYRGYLAAALALGAAACPRTSASISAASPSADSSSQLPKRTRLYKRVSSMSAPPAG